MKKKSIFYHLLCALLGCIVCSCSTNDVVPVTTKHNYMDPVTYSAMMSIPEGERELVLECRKAAMIIGEHVNLDNYKYTLEISKEEANKLGIRDIIYDLIYEDIEQVNKFASESMAKGDTIPMPDVKKHFKRYKNPEINYNPETFKSRKSISRSGPAKASGRIETHSNGAGEDSFQVSSGITTVDFYCISKKLFKN